MSSIDSDMCITIREGGSGVQGVSRGCPGGAVHRACIST